MNTIFNKIHNYFIVCGYILLSLFIHCSLGATINASHEDKSIVVVVPSYNNIQWLERNLGSILMQKHSNFRVIYINDKSRDKTGEMVEEYVRQRGIDYRAVTFEEKSENSILDNLHDFIQLVNQETHFFTLVNNAKRCGALENLYRGIHSCHNRDIVATVDGDDFLFDDEALKRINDAYASDKVWLTHGCLIEYPHGHVSWSEPIPPHIIKANAFRTFKCPSHCRTFYAGLFKKIQLPHLLYEGKLFPMAWDMAMMYPMAEMAGERHAYLSQVNYVYNMANQLNDNKVNPDLQNYLDRLIRGMPRYERLPDDFNITLEE